VIRISENHPVIIDSRDRNNWSGVEIFVRNGHYFLAIYETACFLEDLRVEAEISREEAQQLYLRLGDGYGVAMCYHGPDCAHGPGETLPSELFTEEEAENIYLKFRF
jgi:hypothetical protein